MARVSGSKDQLIPLDGQYGKRILRTSSKQQTAIDSQNTKGKLSHQNYQSSSNKLSRELRKQPHSS